MTVDIISESNQFYFESELFHNLQHIRMESIEIKQENVVIEHCHHPKAVVCYH